MNEDEKRIVCNSTHARIKVSTVYGEDALVPAWPLPGAETHCVCRAALEYRHSIDVLIGVGRADAHSTKLSGCSDGERRYGFATACGITGMSQTC